jgi:hypothetical protein
VDRRGKVVHTLYLIRKGVIIESPHFISRSLFPTTTTHAYRSLP